MILRFKDKVEPVESFDTLYDLMITGHINPRDFLILDDAVKIEQAVERIKCFLTELDEKDLIAFKVNT